jgi:hypothetical protein
MCAANGNGGCGGPFTRGGRQQNRGSRTRRRPPAAPRPPPHPPPPRGPAPSPASGPRDMSNSLTGPMRASAPRAVSDAARAGPRPTASDVGAGARGRRGPAGAPQRARTHLTPHSTPNPQRAAKTAPRAGGSDAPLPPRYCEHVYKTVRRPTRTINVSVVEGGRRRRGRGGGARRGSAVGQAASARGLTRPARSYPDRQRPRRLRAPGAHPDYDDDR